MGINETHKNETLDQRLGVIEGYSVSVKIFMLKYVTNCNGCAY